MPDAAIDSVRKIPFSFLTDNAQLAKLLSAMDWFAGELRRG
jgi:hypothetical protein